MAPPKKKGGLSRTAAYYRSHPEAREKKKETDNEVNRRPEQKAKRRELDKARRGAVKRGANVEGKDMAHGKDGKLRLKDSSKNRGDKNDTRGDKKARGKKKK